ncbi:MAG: hypothetical protein KA105_01590 [Caulobacter sp.]|nr:hypothetical protein [Caulobacter sp.]
MTGSGALALLLFTTVPEARAAERSELFAMFESVCLSSAGDNDEGRAQATALGFAPARDVPSSSGSESLERKSGGRTYRLSLYSRAQVFDRNGPRAIYTDCSITVAEGDPAAPPAMRAWMAMAPSEDSGAWTSYVFREVDGVRTRLPDELDDRPMRDLLQEGPVRFVTVLHGDLWGKPTTVLGIAVMALTSEPASPPSGP